MLETVCEILPSETPGEGFVERGVALTEGMDSRSELVQRAAVIRSECLALDDRTVDLNLIEPAGMHWCMHNDDARVTLPKFVDRALATMGRAVVDNPEHRRAEQ